MKINLKRPSDLEECEERLLNDQVYLDAVYKGFLEWQRQKNERDM